jgi:hypothetical protein
MCDTGLCKNPRIRFETFLALLKPSEVAAAIVSAQRKGMDELTVPRKLIFHQFKFSFTMNIFHFRLLIFPQRNPPNFSHKSKQSHQRFL